VKASTRLRRRGFADNGAIWLTMIADANELLYRHGEASLRHLGMVTRAIVSAAAFRTNM
jgi:hypothetical protein